MATTTIPWGDGSGDNIYLTYPSASGNQTVQVSSDANAGAARTKVVTFAAGNITKQLTVNQEAALVPITDTLEVNPSSYDNTDYAYYSLSNVANAYADADSTTYATIGLTRGEGAVTYVYFKFDTSSIPADATINSVACIVRCSSPSTTNNTNIATRQVQLFTGTTAKGAPSSINATTGTGVQYTLDVGTWTRQELADARVRIYGVRGTRNLTSNYAFRFHGATLTINYTYMG